MNTNLNTAPRKQHTAGTTQANAAATAARRDALCGDDGKILYTAEEARDIRMMEAAQERERLDRLRKEADARWAEERRMKPLTTKAEISSDSRATK
jgi:hypothetical protein